MQHGDEFSGRQSRLGFSLVVAALFFCGSTALAKGEEKENLEPSILNLVSRLKTEATETDSAFLDSLKSNFEDAAAQGRSLTSLALGSYYLESNYRLATQYLAAAEVASGRSSELLPIIRYHMAVAKMKGGAYKDAAQILEKIMATGIGKAWEKEILSLLIESYFNLGDYQKLSDTFIEYSKRYASSRRQESLVRMAAETFEIKEQHEEMVDILEELVGAYPTTEASRWAFLKLQDLSCKRSKKGTMYAFPRHLLLLLSRNTTLDTGLKEFIIAAADMPMQFSKTSVHKLSPREKIDFFFHARFYDEALRETKEQLDLLGRKEGLQAASERLSFEYLMGRIYMRMNKFDLAARHFSNFIAGNPGAEQVSRAQEALGDAFKYLGYPLIAAEQYRLAATVRNNDLLRWEQFWNTYLGGAYQDALTMLDTPGFVTPKDKDDAETLIYWRGKILERLGRTEEGKNAFAKLLQSDAQSFYANLIATEYPGLIIKPLPSIDSERGRLVKADLSPGFRFAAKVMRPSLNADSYEDAGEELPVRPELRLVDQLIKVGMKDSAQIQLASVSWNDYDGEDAFAAVSRLAWLLDDYQPTRRLKFRNFSALRMLPPGWWDLRAHQKEHADEWKVYYPMAFKKIVVGVTEKVELSKYLLLSVMRAESFYNKDARSGVGARGLMQIMPYTAIRIAKLLQDQDFDTEKLAEPEVSIGYGGYYMDKLLTYYENNPFVAVAAYNAGPMAVNRWLDACLTCSTDEFVESIPFKETRRYVREVMRNYGQYMRIYENQETMQKMPALPKHRSDPAEIF